MKVGSGRELFFHALTAALPPLAVFLLEMHIKDLSSGWLVGVLFVLYIAAFLLIFAVDKLLQTLMAFFPIRLPNIGRIDGWWIDIVRDLGGDPLGGATIHIRSLGEGFKLQGTIYILNDKPTELKEVGWFIGNGYATVSGDTVGYCFDGELHSQKDVGSGHFTFIPPKFPAKDTTRAKGSFIGIKSIAIGHTRPAHHFEAEKVSGNSEEAAEGVLLTGLLKAMEKLKPEPPKEAAATAH
jgi:hypothetical protein